MTPERVREGDVLAGKYRVEKVLGSGAMGVVVAARHVRLDDRVAIKLLLPEMVTSAEAVTRFEREARAAVKIKSEHVARVLDVGNLASGAPFIVMEYLEGQDLAAWLRREGPLPIEQAVDFVLQALEGVAEAHALGIVHRDLKPANLFCVQRAGGYPSIKVLDFGISKMSAGVPGEMSITATAVAMGTPLYMSPEQMQSSRDVDASTDIWSMAVILHELVTGRPPFAASTIPELVLRIADGQPDAVAKYRPGAPPVLDEVISRCLQKDRKERYSNVAELAAALGQLAPAHSAVSVERIARVLRAENRGSDASATALRSDVRRGRSGATMGTWGQTLRSPAARTSVVVVATAVGGLALLMALPFSMRSVPGNDGASAAPHASEPAPAAVVPSPATSNPSSSPTIAESMLPVSVPSEDEPRDTSPPAGAKENHRRTPLLVTPPRRIAGFPQPVPVASVPSLSASPAASARAALIEDRR
jgi:serine/threonine-protein kinase